MTLYEIRCRPHGRPDLPATLRFLLDAIDHRSAWQEAMHHCFRGGDAITPDGATIFLEARRWTVRKVSVFTAESEKSSTSEIDDWPRPPMEMVKPDAREAALHKIYAGRVYDDYRIRSSNKVLSFGGSSRPISVSRMDALSL